MARVRMPGSSGRAIRTASSDTYPFFVDRLKNSCRRKSLTCPRRNNVVHMAYVESAVRSGGDREPVPAMV